MTGLTGTCVHCGEPIYAEERDRYNSVGQRIGCRLIWCIDTETGPRTMCPVGKSHSPYPPTTNDRS